MEVVPLRFTPQVQNMDRKTAMSRHRTILRDELVARPLAEWHEDMGDVLWWKFPIEEAPYVGSPNDLGFPIASCLYDQHGRQIGEVRANVGGWPGYHTHWTPIVSPLIRSDIDAKASAGPNVARDGGVVSAASEHANKREESI